MTGNEKVPERIWLTHKEISGHDTWVEASGCDATHFQYVRADLLATARREALKEAVDAAESAFVNGGEVTHKHIEIGNAIVQRIRALEASASEKGEMNG